MKKLSLIFIVFVLLSCEKEAILPVANETFESMSGASTGCNCPGFFENSHAGSCVLDGETIDAEIDQTKVHDRIHRWAGSSSSLSHHYENGSGQIAFGFSCADLCTLVTQVSNGESKPAGIRMYFGMTGTNTTGMSQLRIFLMPVDVNGGDMFPTDENKFCLGFTEGMTVIPIVDTLSCLGLGTANSALTNDPASGFVSKVDFLKYRRNFLRSLPVDPNHDGARKCNIAGCQTAGGYWYSSYTFCLQAFAYLLQKDGADGIRFYFGVRTSSSVVLQDFTEHTCAIVATKYDSNAGLYGDICPAWDNTETNKTAQANEDEIYFIDWAHPCPTLCNGGHEDHLDLQ